MSVKCLNLKMKKLGFVGEKKEQTVLCCKSLNNDETINPYICSNDKELSLDLIDDNEIKETSVLQPRIEFEQSVNRKK